MKRYMVTLGSLHFDPLTDPLGIGVEAASAQDALFLGLGAMGRAGRLVAGDLLARVRDVATPIVHAMSLRLTLGGIEVRAKGGSWEG